MNTKAGRWRPGPWGSSPAETVVSAGLACVVPRVGVGEHAINFDSKSNASVLTTGNAKMPDILIPDDLETALGKDFGVIPQVRHVLTEWVDGPLLVWIALDNPEPSVRKAVYQKELELMDGFPEIDFDFNLIGADGRNAEEFATGAHVVFSRQE